MGTIPIHSYPFLFHSYTVQPGKELFRNLPIWFLWLLGCIGTSHAVPMQYLPMLALPIPILTRHAACAWTIHACQMPWSGSINHRQIDRVCGEMHCPAGGEGGKGLRGTFSSANADFVEGLGPNLFIIHRLEWSMRECQIAVIWESVALSASKPVDVCLSVAAWGVT